MKVNAIVAEYNPFHNGHKYHMTEASRQTGADYTIIIMSGNYVQRGAPALLDKYTRARMALECGADLCLELPTCYAASSAEFFATGAVALADRLGVVTNLCFGSESGEIQILQQIASILLEEPEGYRNYLKAGLRQGLSYPIARTNALLQYDSSLSAYRDVLGTPNNILGIEYVKALMRRQSNISPITTMRVGASYHDRRLGEFQCSAQAIRQALQSGQSLDILCNQMPDNVFALMQQAHRDNRFLRSNDFSSALHYKLICESKNGYEQYLDISPELSDRIVKNLYRFNDYTGFCDLLKSKDMTYTRISRCLLHILLDIRKDTLRQNIRLDYVPYAKILGFRKDSTELLGAIKTKSSIPLVSKLADAKELLPEASHTMLREEIRMNDIYQSVLAQKSKYPMANEYSTPLVII